MIFENNWLAQYPQPSYCIQDNSGEFTGAAFLHILRVNGIKGITTKVKNPQADAICERLHQSISNTLLMGADDLLLICITSARLVTVSIINHLHTSVCYLKTIG